MLEDDPQFMPYPPASKTVGVVRRIHEGTAGTTLSQKQLVSLGIAEGNSDRVQKALRFLGLIDAEGALTALATRLRKATSDEYPTLLAEIIRSAYAPVFVAYPDPSVATAIDLNNAFKPYDPAGQRQNMIALFLALCREAGLVGEASGTPRRAPKGPSTRQGAAPKGKGGGSAPPPPPGIQTPPPPPFFMQTDGVLFHPAIDSFLREARKITEGDGWTKEARDRIVNGFATQLDLFLPVKNETRA